MAKSYLYATHVWAHYSAKVSTLTNIPKHSGEISEDMVEKYKKEDGKKPVKLKHKKDFKGKKYKVLERDLLHETDFIRHSPQKIGKVIEDIVEGWIK